MLRAVPQNLSREAYKQLQEAVYPLVLPYHQPLALARAYLAHLGVTRLELMRTLGRGDRLRDAASPRRSGMSPEEFAVVARAPTDLWRHFGSRPAPMLPARRSSRRWRTCPRSSRRPGSRSRTLIDLVSTRFLNADNQLQLDTPYARLQPRHDSHRRPRRGAAVADAAADPAAAAARLAVRRCSIARSSAFGAGDLDAAGAREARDRAAARGQRSTGPSPELLVLWARSTRGARTTSSIGCSPTRAVTWRTQDERTFQLRPDRTELAETGPSLDAVASALLAAFRITSEELALIRALLTRRGAEPRLDLAGLSAIYRVVVLARALQLRIPALDLLLRLTPPEADPFRPGDPAATRRFVDIVREVQASDFTPERLAYLFRHEVGAAARSGPLPAQVEAVLASIRRGLADAFAETSHPAEVTGDVLRQKLGDAARPGAARSGDRGARPAHAADTAEAARVLRPPSGADLRRSGGGGGAPVRIAVGVRQHSSIEWLLRQPP